MRERDALPHLQLDCPLPPDKSCVLVPLGLGRDDFPVALLQRRGYASAPYRLVSLPCEAQVFGLGRHLLYLPSLLGIWALRQNTWCEATFSGLVTDGSLVSPSFTLKGLRARLLWERARLGGDVASFFMRQSLSRTNISADFAQLTIADWLNLFAAPLPEYSFAQDYVFTLGRGHDMEDWLCRHGAE